MLRFGTGFCFLCSVKNKSGLKNMSIMVLFRKNVYLCSKFMQEPLLYELTYRILADLSARLNLVNSTIDARTCHSRFVPLWRTQAALFVSHQGLPEPNRGNGKGIPCSPFLQMDTAEMQKPVRGSKN